jgi:hypothetical protein
MPLFNMLIALHVSVVHMLSVVLLTVPHVPLVHTPIPMVMDVHHARMVSTSSLSLMHHALLAQLVKLLHLPHNISAVTIALLVTIQV